MLSMAILTRYSTIVGTIFLARSGRDLRVWLFTPCHIGRLRRIPSSQEYVHFPDTPIYWGPMVVCQAAMILFPSLLRPLLFLLAHTSFVRFTCLSPPPPSSNT